MIMTTIKDHLLPWGQENEFGKYRTYCVDFRIGDYRTIDWVHDSVKDQFRKKKLRSMTGVRGIIVNALDALEGWILVGIIGTFCLVWCIDVGLVTALIAYCIDVWESVLFDWKEGYCTSMHHLEILTVDNWTLDKKFCCIDIKRTLPT
jgi:chloride channel 3/4/5